MRDNSWKLKIEYLEGEKVENRENSRDGNFEGGGHFLEPKEVGLVGRMLPMDKAV